MPAPQEMFVKLPDLARSLGSHPAMIRMMCRFGLMPLPYKCDDGSIRWKCSEIAAWIAHEMPTIDQEQLDRAQVELAFLTRDDLADLLGIHVSTINRMVQDGRIPKPCLQANRMTRWSLESIGNWIREGCPVVDPSCAEKN